MPHKDGTLTEAEITEHIKNGRYVFHKHVVPVPVSVGLPGETVEQPGISDAQFITSVDQIRPGHDARYGGQVDVEKAHAEATRKLAEQQALVDRLEEQRRASVEAQATNQEPAKLPEEPAGDDKKSKKSD